MARRRTASRMWLVSVRVGLEELEPRRRRVEQVAHLDAGAARDGGGRGPRALRPPATRKRPALAGAPRARRDLAARHGADRRQRLAAEAQRRDVHQIVGRRAWRWRGARSRGRARRASCRSRRRRRRSARARHRASATSMRVAPASMAFSTSSFTTEAGRSTTSPAAMRLTRVSGRRRMGMAGLYPRGASRGRRCGMGPQRHRDTEVPRRHRARGEAIRLASGALGAWSVFGLG